MSRILISIGCDQYTELPSLEGAENDATKIYNLLTGYEGEYDADKSELLLSPSLSDLQKILSKSLFTKTKIDVLTLFYAGHGAVKSGNYYLCLSDTNADKLSTTGLPLVNLFAIISECYPQQVNIVIDACQSGGAMLDMTSVMKPEIIGEAQSLSISFLAACATNQYAYEENQAGIATTEILKYLNGEEILQDTRSFLDLVELGQVVSVKIANSNFDQTPVTWGLNLYGQGKFAKNPHYDGEANDFPLRIVRIAPNSDIGQKVQQYSEALWSEYRKVTTEPSNRRLVNLLSRVSTTMEQSGGSCLPLIRGFATSLRARASTSIDLFAESDVLMCCCVALLPYLEQRETQNALNDLLEEYFVLCKSIREKLLAEIKNESRFLVSPVGSAGDFYYLPIRITKVLGWLGISIIIDQLTTRSEENLQEEVKDLIEIILGIYEKTLVTMSDEQAPPLYLFSKACEIGKWQDLAEFALQKYFENILLVKGAVTKPQLEAEKAFSYIVNRGIGQPARNFKLIANPSELISVLLLCGLNFNLREAWNKDLILLDHLSFNFFLPDDYSAFGDEVINNGTNNSYTIGQGIWTMENLSDEFRKNCLSTFNNKTISQIETQICCVFASYLFPNRVPYFLENFSNSQTVT